MKRVLLLIAAHAGADPKHVSAELSGRAAPIRQRATDAGVRVRLGTQIADDPLAAAAEATGRDVAPIRALIEVTGAPDCRDDVLVSVLRGFGSWFGGVFDQHGSTAALGTVHEVTAGCDGPTMLALGTQRLPDLSPERFREHWAGIHAPLALSLMPKNAAERIGYQQLHVDRDASARAAETAAVGRSDLDGVLQVLCREPADFLGFAAAPSFASRIYDDERKFAEASGMRGGFFRLGA